MPGYNYNMHGYSYNDNLITTSIGNDGTIFQESMSNGRTKIGIDNQREKEMQETIDNYYNKLVELGVIVPEKTQEQIIQENTKHQGEMLLMIKSLTEEIKELKSNANSNNVTKLVSESSSTDSKKKPTGDK